MKIQEER